MPRNYGLWASGSFAFRNDRSVAKFRHAWWQEVSETSARDQISLPYAVRQKGFAENIKTIDEDVFDNKYIHWLGHKSESVPMARTAHSS